MTILKRNLFARLQAEQTADGGTGGGGAPAITPEIQALIDASVNTAVTGLKTKNSELLGKLKETSTNLQRFEGIDPDAVRNILSKFANDEEAGLIAAGKVDEVLNKRTERMKAGYESETAKERTAREAAEARANKFSKRVLENGIRAAAATAGIHQFAFEDAMYRAASVFTLDEDGNPTAAEGAFGKDGKPLTLKEWFGDMKEKAPHWFPASASGGGATGYSANAGQKTITQSQFDAMTPKQRAEAFKSGATLV